MAETASGGWVRSASRSAASTRPWASARGAISGGMGLKPVRILSSALATGRSAVASVWSAGGAGAPGSSVTARLAAGLLDEPHPLDPHAALDGLAYVVCC